MNNLLSLHWNGYEVNEEKLSYVGFFVIFLKLTALCPLKVASAQLNLTNVFRHFVFKRALCFAP